ncbi:TonB family protein [Sphingomonas oligoaromativorans]|uniref:TonB family protein n=1 Tax=Sphingomonas oligoaromativorans TaxID=575322 RepID=UPI001420E9C4|nr:TonB family protein [Sphingomonas oligoaromativorans]NIJ33778.1 TonB family protein [Sphingomonas oligoaromativorans]
MPADAPADNGEIPACSIDPKTISTLFNGNAYPTAEAARRIEGYAIVGYDTAPWGAIGNVHVIASEPDQAFGQAARNALFSAKIQTSDVGHVGCVRRVRFHVPMERPGG